MQALSGVQIAADDGRAELRATDMEVGLRVPLDATDRARRARSSCRRACCSTSSAQLPAGDVSLELRPAEQDVEIVAGHRDASTSARCAPRTSPRCPSPAATRSSRMPAPAFIETIARVARSASRDETRPILTGILVSAAGHELRMVATDSYRLSVKETTLETPLDPTASRPTCRPARCEELGRLVRDDVDDDPHRRARRTRSSSRSAASCCRRA